LADSIYKIIPPNEVKYEQETLPEEDFLLDDSLLKSMIKINHISSDENGRKLLIFSDNRQEASYFAGYMDKKYKQNLWRRLIVQELKRSNGGLLMEDLISRLVQSSRQTQQRKNRQTFLQRTGRETKLRFPEKLTLSFQWLHP
jgi:hypothetical protein